jgi:hypothetical protein
VIVAAVAALVSARVGHDLRVAADEHFGSPAPASVEMRWRSVSRPPPLAPEEDTQMKRSGLATHRRRD